VHKVFGGVFSARFLVWKIPLANERRKGILFGFRKKIFLNLC